jgi:biotin synthase
MGETWEQRVEFALTLRELDVDSIPLNFLNPIPGTRLADRPLMSPMDALKSISLFRFVNPEKDMTICGGREVVLKDFQSWLFVAGANGVMVGNYLTTDGRGIEADMDMIWEQGLTCRT